MADSASALTTKLQEVWMRIQLGTRGPEIGSGNGHAIASARVLEEQSAALRYIDDMLMKDEIDEESTEVGVGTLQAELADLLDDSNSGGCAGLSSRARSFYENSDGGRICVLQQCATWPGFTQVPKHWTAVRRNHRLSKLWQQLGLEAGKIQLLEKLVVCAEAVSAVDLTTAWQCVGDIRQEAGPQGNAVQRVVYYFLDALVAKMSGTGVKMFSALSNSRVAKAVRLGALKMILGSTPFLSLPYLFANKTILEAVKGARKVHILDFGIMYGEQWPRLFQLLAERDGGPPEVRLTAIDLPVPGFKPSARIRETGFHLKQCATFWGIRFSYQSLSTRWEKVQVRVDEEEVLIVNALFKQANLFDEAVSANSAKSQWLRSVSSLRPKLFIQGVTSSGSSCPIFMTRFEEALLHHTAAFSAMDKCIPTMVAEKVVIEQVKYAKEIMNIVACDGLDRVERSETHRQWHRRAEEADLESLPLSVEILDECCELGRRYGLTVDSDGDWVELGLEHQVIHAYSAWRPRSIYFDLR